MQSHSFLHPDYAYKISNAHQKQQELALQAPDIFVVPPEEDQTPPWCCYNSQQGLANEDEEEYTLRYPQASSYTPFFNRDVSGIEGLILPARKESSETRSIVDALGDADDFSDHEFDHEPIGMDSEEDEEDDGILPEMETNYGRTHQHQHYPQEFGVQLRSPRLEVDNDPDIVEVVKVRRKSAFHNDPDNSFWASSGSITNKSTLRSRATKAFQSLRGSLRTSSKTAPKHKDSGGSLSNFRSQSSLGFRSNSQSRPRAQDVFSPIENIPRSERSHTPELRRRPSSRLSELFGPALKRRASIASFTSTHKSPAPVPQSQESPILSSQKASRPSDGSHTPPRRSPSGAHNELTNTKQGDIPTPTGNHFQRWSEDDVSTPSRRISETRNQDPLRSISPTPASQTKSSLPGNRQAKRGFSVLNLHKIFHKHAPKSSSDTHPQTMRQTSGSSSTCPSLSSTPTSECDSVPQTPTSFDENEVRRTIVPVQSSSTVGSGISLGSSLQSAAVSCLSSSSVTSEATVATPGHDFNQPKDASSGKHTVIHGPRINGSAPELSRPSISSSHSAISTNTVDGERFSANGRMSESTTSSLLEASSDPPFDMTLHLDLDLDLGLGINMAPSSSGGMLSSNGMGKANASGSTLRKNRGRANLSRSLSLKSLGNKLGIGKQDAPPVPPLPRQSGGDMDFEMRLDSLHFDDMSFDADRFIVR